MFSAAQVSASGDSRGTGSGGELGVGDLGATTEGPRPGTDCHGNMVTVGMVYVYLMTWKDVHDIYY